MKWITALDMQQWADQLSARADFPALIADLIRASASDISDIRFPNGDKGQVRGFDGWLEAAGAPPYVPSGLSIWEFGVSDDQKSKCQKDYDKRVKEIAAADRAKMTFVFTSPRSWDNPLLKLPDWVKELRDKKDFADVRYIDGVQLEAWLGDRSAVAAQYARSILGKVPQTGARSTNEFWTEYSHRYRPAITEDVVLCAREDQAREIVTHLLGKPGSLVFVGDGPDEVTAVAIAAIRRAEPDSRAFLEARTLVVDTEDAGRRLGVAASYGFVISPGANKISGYLSHYGPTVSGLGFDAAARQYSRLDRPSIQAMTVALQTTGLSEEEAFALAVKSGRSLTILERHAPAASFEAPEWVRDGADLLAALLAGGWDSRHEGDQAILAELGRADYHSVEAKLRKFIDRPDAPLDREGGVWKLRAPVDAFAHLARLVGPEHMVLLEGVVAKVFAGAPPPKIGEERFGVSTAPFSSWLRDGIANMLLMLSVLHAEVGLDAGGEDPSVFVTRLVGGLPGLSDDKRVIMSLERQLPVLMEAAPDPLVSALELLLQGDVEKFVSIFTETDNYRVPQTYLPNMLWGLETLAWDPARLPRVGLLLARMAAIDPGGRSANRPIASLRKIFLPWSPGTNAPLAARLGTIDAITAQVPEVGWTLLCQLLPNGSDWSIPTNKPRYREAGASSREVLTPQLVSESYEAIVDRALSLVGDDCARWLALIDAFPRFSPDRRAQFFDMLEPWAAALAAEVKADVRAALARIVYRHARFRKAGWALPDSDLKRLEATVASLDSHDPVEQARLLFDERLDYADSERRLTEQRCRALAGLAAKGAEPILALARKSRVPRLVASAAAEAIDDDSVVIALIDEAAGGDRPLRQFAEALAGALRWRRGEDFDAKFLDIARERGWSVEKTVALMLDWPEALSTWTLIERLGAEANALFWSQREPRRFDGSASDLATLVEHYLSAGRPDTALEAIHGREDEVAWPLINRILSARAPQINRNGSAGYRDGYLVEELFKKLRKRDDLPTFELARLEYAYLPILEHGNSDLTVYALMASDPEFFVSVLSEVFVADDANPDDQETSKEERRRAKASYRLLTKFNRVPGETNGLVDGAVLDVWVDGVINAAGRAKRLKTVYSYIGRSLAHSAEKDGVWPQAPIAAVVERLASPDLERGLMIERFNMRGVYTKAMFEGGKQERDFAARYRQWRAQLSPAYQRTSAMLESIARQWDADAKEADQAAARDKLRFE